MLVKNLRFPDFMGLTFLIGVWPVSGFSQFLFLLRVLPGDGKLCHLVSKPFPFAKLVGVFNGFQPGVF